MLVRRRVEHELRPVFRENLLQPLPVAQSVGGIAPIGPALAWLGQRIRGDAVDPPR